MSLNMEHCKQHKNMLQEIKENMVTQEQMEAQDTLVNQENKVQHGNFCKVFGDIDQFRMLWLECWPRSATGATGGH